MKTLMPFSKFVGICSAFAFGGMLPLDWRGLALLCAYLLTALSAVGFGVSIAREWYSGSSDGR